MHPEFTTDKAQQTIERFWSKVDKSSHDSCWLWTAGTDKDGYGKFKDRHNTLGLGVFLRSHRVAYVLSHGPIPEGHGICHSCDTPACVNPDHLWPGTTLDNNRDMIRKGRKVVTRGQGFSDTILTEEQVREIRETYRFRHPEFGGVALAKRYGVTKSTISAIIRRKQWRHVE